MTAARDATCVQPAASSPPGEPRLRDDGGAEVAGRPAGAQRGGPGPAPSRYQPVIPPREKRLPRRGAPGAPPTPAPPAGQRGFGKEPAGPAKARGGPRGAEPSPATALCGGSGPPRTRGRPRTAQRRRSAVSSAPQPPPTPRRGAPGGRAPCPAPRATCRDGREGLSPRTVISPRQRAARAAGSGRRSAGEGHRSARPWLSPVPPRRRLTAVEA